jgi:hypothetical protein
MFIRGFTDVLVLEMGMLQVSIRCFFDLENTNKKKSKLEKIFGFGLISGLGVVFRVFLGLGLV